MNKQLGAVVIAWGLCAAMTGIALADLKAVDPGPYSGATGHFPLWYQDNNDLALELCQSKALSPTGGYLCTLIPEAGVYDDTQPMVFADNWPSELFWFLAETSIPAGSVNGYEVEVYVAGIEAAFAGGPPKPGDQQSFARIRIRASVPNNRRGTYTITHPYGVETVTVTQGGRRAINITRDIGVGGPVDFSGALGGAVGPFLTSASGTVTATNPETGAQEIFIGDPNIPGPVVPITNPVTGLPVDYLEISGPAGTLRTNLFSVSGKILDSRPATPLTVERSTYSRNAAGSRISVFAQSNPANSVCYRETLALLPGTPPSPCLRNLLPDGQGYFFHSDPFPQSLPPFLVVTASDPTSLSRPTAVSSPLTDVVKISSARFDRDTGTLTIEATSSDEVLIPDLAATGFGRLNKAGTLQSLTVTGLFQPPAQVTVKSAAGGSDTEAVSVRGSAPDSGDNQPPVGVADSTSTSPGAAVDIAVLSNDSDPDGNPFSVASVTQPAEGGSVTINPGGASLRYTPPTTVTTAFTASFSYVLRDSLGALSEPVGVTVSVSASDPTNQPPLANPDSASTTPGNAISINVLGNDSDPEGHPFSVTGVTQPATGQGSVTINANGTLLYTPPTTVATAFTASFSYTVTDSLGAAAIGSVTVSVSASPVNLPPTVGNDTASTSDGVPVTINVLANDSDPEGHPFSVTSVTQPGGVQGSVAINADGSLLYTPPPADTIDTPFTATFTYTVTDSLGASATATVSVLVQPLVTEPPPAVISVTTATVRAGNGGRFTWELSGTTTQTNSNLTIEVTTTNGLALLGTVTPNRRTGSWSLTVRNTTQFPPINTPSATITATATGASITVPVQRL
ncbi:MAG: Ig-like domain-containing protein [Pseudomonas sagittaria]|nr:Ig-like domain-containing protein [Pseudomonas sagittaria]